MFGSPESEPDGGAAAAAAEEEEDEGSSSTSTSTASSQQASPVIFTTVDDDTDNDDGEVLYSDDDEDNYEDEEEVNSSFETAATTMILSSYPDLDLTEDEEEGDGDDDGDDDDDDDDEGYVISSLLESLAEQDNNGQAMTTAMNGSTLELPSNTDRALTSSSSDLDTSTTLQPKSGWVSDSERYLFLGAQNLESFLNHYKRVEDGPFTLRMCLAVVTSVIKMSGHKVTELKEVPYRLDYRSLFYSMSFYSMSSYWTSDDFKSTVSISPILLGEYYDDDFVAIFSKHRTTGVPCERDIHVPKEVVTIFREMAGLRILRLSGNIASLPDDIGEVHTLTHIILVDHLPKFPNMPHVKVLEFSARRGWSSFLDNTGLDPFSNVEKVRFVDRTAEGDLNFRKHMADILLALPNPHTIQNIDFHVPPDWTNTYKLVADDAGRLILEVLPRFPNLQELCWNEGCSVDSLIPIAESINNTTARNKLRVEILFNFLPRTLGMKLQDGENGDENEIDACCKIIRLICKPESHTTPNHEESIATLEFGYNLHPKIQYQIAMNAAERLLFEYHQPFVPVSLMPKLIKDCGPQHGSNK